MPTWIEEGKRNCSSCGAVNPGRNKSCSECGNAFEENEPTYFDEAPSYDRRVREPELVRQFSVGPDWPCAFCGGVQWNDKNNCVNCGASKQDSLDQERRHPETPTYESSQPDRFDAFPERNYRGLAIGAIALVILVFLGWFLFRTTEKDLTVSAVSWERQMEVLRYKIFEKEGFEDDMPSDAFDKDDQGLRHHHYREYQCGTKEESYTESEPCGESCYTTSVSCTDNKNGSRTCSGGDRVCDTKYCDRTKTRTVPKYCEESIKKTYYTWKVWRWAHERTVNVDGKSVDTVRWPNESELRLNIGCRGGEKEKIGDTSESYLVTFSDAEGDTYSYRPSSEEEFRTLPVGSAHPVKHSIIGGIDLGK